MKIKQNSIKNITSETVWQLMPSRTQDSHKGTYGKLLCVAGSSRYRGAAALTTEGALRGGCGIVTLASVEPVFASVQPRLPEAILLACEPDPDGGIAETNIPLLRSELKNGYSALLMGPGMGNTPDTGQLVRELVSNAACTVILDADALNALSDPAANGPNPSTLPQSARGVSANTHNLQSAPVTREFPSVLPAAAAGHQIIITPHPGEMARLCGCTISDIKADRERIALAYAKKNDCIVVLKEHRTLIASPDGQLWRNTSGNSGLARGGSGDILAGIMGALTAWGMTPLDAAICSVWLHGTAAERCSARKSETAMLPHDIFEDLGKILLEHGR